MVGVARIELATPTMSTERVGAKSAENRHSGVPFLRNGTGISQEHRRFSPREYRARQVLVRNVFAWAAVVLAVGGVVL